MIFNALEMSGNIRKKTEKNMIRSMYRRKLEKILFSMFEWKGLPEEVRQEYIERMLYLNGSIRGTLIYDKPIFFIGGYSGDVNDYGVGTNYVGATSKRSIEGVIDKDICVCWNNALCEPSIYYINYIASKITEIDVSEDILVVNTRLHQIPIASNSSEKQAILDAMDNIKEGKSATIFSENLLKDFNEGKHDIPVVSLTDTTKIDKLQYLSKFREDWLKDFYTTYGQPMQTSTKMAQTSIDEIHGEDTVSYIEPLNMLKQRKDFCDKCNSILGTNFSVDFSESWKKGEKDIKTNDSLPKDEKAEDADFEQDFIDEERSGSNE